MQQPTKESEWWKRGNFYSLYIDKFAGDTSGLISKLDYFSTLGIDCLHILPHYPSPMRDGGFDIIDHTGVRKELGTVEDFKRLCAEAHQRGIKIMVDLVFNHTSSDHPWFVEARSSKDNPKRDFYLWSDTGTEYEGAPNVFTDFKDNNWLFNEATGDYYFATFKPSQPDLNWRNEKVVRAMLDVVDTLIGYGVDGFRLDAVIHLVEEEGTNSIGTKGTHECIKKVRSHIEEKHPGVILLGEIIETTDDARVYFGEGDECHLSYSFEIMTEILYALRVSRSWDRFDEAIEHAKSLPPHASWMVFLRNHDSVNLKVLDDARHQELLKVLDPHKKYAFNIGTETVMRLFDVCDGDEKLLREAFEKLYSVPFATVMYYGDEIGMPTAALPAGEDDMRYAGRAPFDWEEAERQMDDPNSLFHFVAKCIKER